MTKTVLQVELVEITDHIFSLVFGIVDFFNAIKDDNHDDLVRHDACLLIKVLIALLNAFNCRFEHCL